MKRFILFLLCCATATAARAQTGMRFSLPPELLDLTNCLALPGAVPLALPDPRHFEVADWAAAPAPTNHTGEFTLAFKRPTYLTGLFSYDASEILYSTGGVWQTLPLGQDAGRRLKSAGFAPGTLVQQIKFRVPAQPEPGTNTNKVYRATLPYASVLPLRLVNVAQKAAVLATVNGRTNDARALTDGLVNPQDNWTLSAGTNAPDDAPPATVAFAWPQPQQFRGLAFYRGSNEPPAATGRIDVFMGDGDPLSPANAYAWRQVAARSSAPGPFRANQFVVSMGMLNTRGVRLVSTGAVNELRLGEVLVLVNPEMKPETAPPPAPKHLAVPRVKPGSIQIDGATNDWPGERADGYALAWDEKNLYLLCEAADPYAVFENKGTNLHEIFAGGDGVELFLQTRAGGDTNRTSAGPGDIRLVFAMHQGRPVCVLYEYRTDELLLLPVTFGTGERATQCDRVTELKEAGVTVKREPGRYTLEAAVPLKALGLDPAALKETRGDLGRIISNALGTGVMGRVCWATPDPQWGTLADAAAARPHRWGTLHFAPAVAK
jgi:hypothetical protein